MEICQPFKNLLCEKLDELFFETSLIRGTIDGCNSATRDIFEKTEQIQSSSNKNDFTLTWTDTRDWFHNRDTPRCWDGTYP